MKGFPDWVRLDSGTFVAIASTRGTRLRTGESSIGTEERGRVEGLASSRSFMHHARHNRKFLAGTAGMGEQVPKVFISYAHADHAICERLCMHLGGLEHGGRIAAFDDRDVRLGEEWDPRIKAELDAAQLIVLIVSADFMGSAYCQTVELRRAMERHGEGSARVVPIIADHCDFGALPISRLQALPKDEKQNLKPLADWRNKNKPLADIAGRIRKLVDELAGRQDEVRNRGGQHSVQFEILRASIEEIEADAIILKYARTLYGADRHVADLLTSTYNDIEPQLPKEDDYRIFRSNSYLRASFVLFVGTASLYSFGYEEIKKFARLGIANLRKIPQEVDSVGLTVHGVGYGLDEVEALKSVVTGCNEAITHKEAPESLTSIFIVERDEARAKRLREALHPLLALGTSKMPSAIILRADHVEESIIEEQKKRVFVAMPFAENMDDVYYYGIQNAVHKADYICERADLSNFTGDVLQWVKARIESAKLVVADLTGANPNVYLEVGYAWGKARPTILVVHKSSSELKFDTAGQRCLIYSSIRELEQKLTAELQALRSS